jgi:hypothetical protein
MSEIRPAPPDRSATSSTSPSPADAARQAGTPGVGDQRRSRRVDCSEAPADETPTARDRPVPGRSTRHSSHPPRRGG